MRSGREKATGRAADLVRSLRQVVGRRLPAELEGERLTVFPRVLEDLIRELAGLRPRGGRAARLRNIAAELDARRAGWPEAGRDFLCGRSFWKEPELRLVSSLLLAVRPPLGPELVLEALEGGEVPRTWRNFALVSTIGLDTVRTRALWRETFLDLCFPGGERDRTEEDRFALWLSFVMGFLRGGFSGAELRLAALGGQMFARGPEWDSRASFPLSTRPRLRKLHPVFDFLGLSDRPEFAACYREVTEALIREWRPGEDWGRVGWIQALCGEEMFLESLDRLETRPDSAEALYALRRSREGGAMAGEQVKERLRSLEPRTLGLVSLVRPDLEGVVAQALGSPGFARGMAWFRQRPAAAAKELYQNLEEIGGWIETHGAALGEAMGVLCSLQVPPGAEVGEEGEPEWLRVSEFVKGFLVPEFDWLIENILHLQAARGWRPEVVVSQARRGRLAAIWALGVMEPVQERSLRVLLELERRGGSSEAEAAREALALIGRRHGELGAREVERRADLWLAWEDGGLEGRPGRVWWEIGGHRVKLSVVQGRVVLSAYTERGPCRGIPAAVRGDPGFSEVLAAKRELRQSYSTFRRRLEEVMEEGAWFTGSEFPVLLGNAVFRDLASRLVLNAEGRELAFLEPEAAEQARAEASGWKRVKVAHPCDLLEAGRLGQWQERLLEARVGQPFKQCFRETYVAEESGEAVSGRFSGRPILARQAFALLRARGYRVKGGNAFREWRADGVRGCFQWTRSVKSLDEHLRGEREEEAVQTGPVWFEALEAEGGKERLALGRVPGRVYSETMRDVDLVVSRAAAGEAGFSSRETMRLRANILQQVARLFGLWQVCVGPEETHVLVEGKRGNYLVHLGSGTVLVEPGRRSLDLRPGKSADRALPFAESDSETERILGLVLWLSRDEEIEDPEFLRQVVG